jgi:hypothetical protein
VRVCVALHPSRREAEGVDEEVVRGLDVLVHEDRNDPLRRGHDVKLARAPTSSAATTR